MPAAKLNKVFLIGNLGRDPEIRSLPSGAPVANFSLATNRRWNDREGNRQEQTEWHNIVCFGRQAEVAGQYLNRGRQIHVEGRIQTRSWEDRQSGEKRYRTEIVCENFQMLGPRGDGGGGHGDSPPSYAYDGGGSGGGDGGDSAATSGGGDSAAASGGGDFEAGEPEDDDIPF
ncbi:MAG: single-stranded DNA-binding protein [Thermoanaerobaculia bacterium]